MHESAYMLLSTAIFRLERPFALTDPVDNTFKISGNQLNYGLEIMAVGALTDDLTIYGGMTFLDPKLEGTGNPATDGKQYVGMPKFRSQHSSGISGADDCRARH